MLRSLTYECASRTRRIKLTANGMPVSFLIIGVNKIRLIRCNEIRIVVIISFFYILFSKILRLYLKKFSIFKITFAYRLQDRSLPSEIDRLFELSIALITAMEWARETERARMLIDTSGEAVNGNERFPWQLVHPGSGSVIEQSLTLIYRSCTKSYLGQRFRYDHDAPLVYPYFNPPPPPSRSRGELKKQITGNKSIPVNR